MDFFLNQGSCQALYGPGIVSLHAWILYLALYKSSRHEEYLQKAAWWGAWVAQSVGHLTSAQVMISRPGSSNPMSGSVLTAQSLEPASDSLSPSLPP